LRPNPAFIFHYRSKRIQKANILFMAILKMKKATYFILVLLTFCSALQVSRAGTAALADENTLLIYFLPNTPDSIINKTRSDYNAIEVKVLPNTQVRIWRFTLPVTLPGNIILTTPIEVFDRVRSNTTTSRPSLNYKTQNLDPILPFLGRGTTTPVNPFPRPPFCMGTNNITVAITDCGRLDSSYDDLMADKTWNNALETPDNRDNDRNGYIDDYTGWNWVANNNVNVDNHVRQHGSFVNMIMAQMLNDAAQASGISSNVKLMNLKAFDENGQGSLRSLLEAIDYAIGKGVKIMNLSVGYPGLKADISNSLLNIVMEIARVKNDMLFVVAAGNANQNLDDTRDSNTVFPAGLPNPNMIVVGAATALGKRTFSNYGATSVDIAALGEQVAIPFGGTEVVVSGTSIATPFVTATAALLGTKSIWRSAAVKTSILNNSTVPTGNPWNGLSVTGKVLNTANILRCPRINGGFAKNNANLTEAAELLTVFPNPCYQTAQIKIKRDETTEAILLIENTLGQVVLNQQISCQAGETVLEWDAKEVKSGIYIVKVQFANQTLTQKIVKQ
jgi:Subtilase family/Secretion system C-terminal sorting domain